jgi:hypothetical protein
MRGVSAGPPLPYRDFYYPLNVFMHILTHEEGGVTYLHYGLFDGEGDSIAAAQERSTDLLLSRLPAPPARLLDVGVGLGTTLNRLTRMGYDAEGITPDAQQIAVVRGRYGEAVRVQCTRFEMLTGGSYDAVLFQESSQYIESGSLFAKARELTKHAIVLDEFALREEEGVTLHRYDAFMAAAEQHGFRKTEELDLSGQAAPTVDYFNQRLPRYRDLLHRDLGLTSQQVDDLIESGHRYRDLYARGVYGYRLIVFQR